MNARAYRLDAESQTADANAAERAEHRAAARFDRRNLVLIGTTYYDADRLPDLRDVTEEAW